jgi:hypothetical protein
VSSEDVSAAILYQELNFKVATSPLYIEKMKHNAKRKARLNYLANKTPYELGEILDQKYWKTHEMWFRSAPNAIK